MARFVCRLVFGIWCEVGCHMPCLCVRPSISVATGEYLSVRNYSISRYFGSTVTRLSCLIGAVHFAEVRFNISAQLFAVEGAEEKGIVFVRF